MTLLGSILARKCQRVGDWEAFLDKLEGLAMERIESGVQITAEAYEGGSISGVPAAMPQALLTAVDEARRVMEGSHDTQFDFSRFTHRT